MELSLDLAGGGTLPADNISSGGLGAEINIDAGIVVSPAFDYSLKRYSVHPITKTEIVGIEIPYWRETLSMVQEMLELVPEIPVVGWDIAITEKGPELVEANSTPVIANIQAARPHGYRSRMNLSVLTNTKRTL